MTRPNSKKIREIAREVLIGWGEEASDKSFGGLDLERMNELAGRLNEDLDRVNELTNALKAARVERDQSARALKDGLKKARYGCMAPPSFGPDSSLYARWGFVPDSRRESGLTRKSEEAPEVD